MGTPCGITHPSIIEGVDADAAVNDGDEVGVSQGVEDGSGPRAVNTGEYEVMVEAPLAAPVDPTPDSAADADSLEPSSFSQRLT